MKNWIVQEKWPINCQRMAQIVCGDWQSPMIKFEDAEEIARARNIDVMAAELQAGLANARTQPEYKQEGQELDQEGRDQEFGPNWRAAVAESKWTPQQGAQEHIADMQELEDLRVWKKSMLQVESQWDEQAVGRALGMTMGDNIRENIMPAIERMKMNLDLTLALLKGVLGALDKAGFPDTARCIRESLEKRKLL